jgi:hypothetical protein
LTAGDVKLKCAWPLPQASGKFSHFSVRQRAAAFTNWFYA